MKNKNIISNPKTIRRYQRYKEQHDANMKIVSDNGYLVEMRNTNNWSFSQHGIKSVLGFDTESEVIEFIVRNLPNPEKIFPPYK